MNEQGIYISEKVRNSSNVVINPATEEKQDSLSLLVTTLTEQWETWQIILNMIKELLTPLSIVSSGSNKLLVDINTIVGGTITTVTTVSTVSNQSNIWGANAFDLQYNMAQLASMSVTNNIV